MARRTVPKACESAGFSAESDSFGGKPAIVQEFSTVWELCWSLDGNSCTFAGILRRRRIEVQKAAHLQECFAVGGKSRQKSRTFAGFACTRCEADNRLRPVCEFFNRLKIYKLF